MRKPEKKDTMSKIAGFTGKIRLGRVTLNTHIVFLLLFFYLVLNIIQLTVKVLITMAADDNLIFYFQRKYGLTKHELIHI